MPIPLIPVILGAIALSTGGYGVVKGVKAAVDNSEANDIDDKAKDIYADAKDNLVNTRADASKALEDLGLMKIVLCKKNLPRFIKLFEQIKNVELTDSKGLNELSKFRVDRQGLLDLKEISLLVSSIAAGTLGGAVAGSAVAFGAYGAAGALATASTGTAIAGLSGVAATNATLAFFGGGSLAAGGLGMAGGTMILGGLVAGPALAVLGAVMGASASTKLNSAYSNLAKAKKVSEELKVLTIACNAIKRRSKVFHRLLMKVDLLFVPMIDNLELIIQKDGTDYRKYSVESKQGIAALLAAAKAFKALVDTPLLDKDGALTDESKSIADSIAKQIAM
ncbi:MAG: hypothetical protein PHS31_02125 [Victivallaceae bacterium]|nr:hypothetical protein [Victivallaceae bacterium]